MRNVKLSVGVSPALLKDIMFSLASLAVVAAAMTAIFMPPRYSIAVSTSATRGVSAANFIDIYGSLKDSTGEPISGASVEVFDGSGKRQDFVKTKADGTFSSHFNDTGGPFTVKITAVINGQTVTGTWSMDMRPGYTYGFVMTVTPDNTIVFVPIPGY